MQIIPTTRACPHQTFCHSDAPVYDAYRPPPFHIWKWWPPLTTKAPTAWHQLALSNSVTTQALYCTVLYYLQSFLFGAMVQFRPVVQFLHTLFEIEYIFHLSKFCYCLYIELFLKSVDLQNDLKSLSVVCFIEMIIEYKVRSKFIQIVSKKSNIKIE